MKHLADLDSYLSKLNNDKKITLFRDTPLSEFSSFKIGGPAKFIVLSETIDVLCDIITFLKSVGERILVFGNASNVLFCDEGIDGVVIFTSHLKEIKMVDNLVYAEAGVNLATLSKFALQNSFTGCEFACGIPGNIGGAVFMNAGAYDSSMSNILQSVTYLNTDTLEIETKDVHDLSFGYRVSEFQEKPYIVLSALFKFAKTDNTKSVDKLMKSYLKSRSEKQPLNYPSAGSTFKRYPGYYTSKLIDEAGLKGETIGGAQVSTKHAGFIINTGNATACEIMQLIHLVQDRIFALYGIHIECEVRYIE